MGTVARKSNQVTFRSSRLRFLSGLLIVSCRDAIVLCTTIRTRTHPSLCLRVVLIVYRSLGLPRAESVSIYLLL